jgi:hypothetical protein
VYLLRALVNSGSRRKVKLFEGFVSFKTKRGLSCHTDDVLCLRDIVWNPKAHADSITAPENLKVDETDSIYSAFKVAGMDFGVPPVITAVAKRKT